MRRTIAVVIVVTLAVVGGACTGDDDGGDSAGGGPTTTGRPRRGGVLRVAIERVRTLDPAQARSPSELVAVDALFDSLTAYDPETNEPRPALAASWQARPDLRQWDFKLRAGARFGND